MKWFCKKRLALTLGVIFIVVGTAVGICGFGMAEFDAGQLAQHGAKPWYQTIAVIDHAWWFGVAFGSGAITSGSIPAA